MTHLPGNIRPDCVLVAAISMLWLAVFVFSPSTTPIQSTTSRKTGRDAVSVSPGFAAAHKTCSRRWKESMFFTLLHPACVLFKAAVPLSTAHQLPANIKAAAPRGSKNKDQAVGLT